MVVRGHNALTPIRPANSAARPSTHIDIPYLLIVYARCCANHRGSRLSGGDNTRTLACGDASRCGSAAWVVANVARTFTPNIRSKRFIGVWSVGVSAIAEAL